MFRDSVGVKVFFQPRYHQTPGGQFIGTFLALLERIPTDPDPEIALSGEELKGFRVKVLAEYPGGVEGETRS